MVMLNEVLIEAAAVAPAPVGDDLVTVMLAYPLLAALHDNQKIIDAQMPPDAAQYSGERISLMPFYMNMFDPNELGYWDVKRGDSFDARLSAIPSLNGVTFGVQVRGQDGKHHAATDAQLHELASVLGFIDTNREALPQPSEAATRRHRSRMPRLGRHVIRQFRHA